MKSLIFILLSSITAFGSIALIVSNSDKSETKSPTNKNQVSLTDSANSDTVSKAIKLNKGDTSISKIDCYETAVNEIVDMLDGKKELSFKRAVFLSENAYYNGSLNWENFKYEIDRISPILRNMVKSKGISQHKTAGNWAIFTYMTDSIAENNYSPYQYDYENFMGDKDFESFMVSTLLKTKKGNCHSLPYLYKILANEIGVEAYVALAPMHCYIKHKDEQGKWWNLELTSGTFSRTSFIIESFNVSDAGIESGLYMKALSEKESVALCLLDILVNFDKQKGIYYGSLVKKAYTAGIKHYPNSSFLCYKMDDLKYNLDNLMTKKGLNDYKQLRSHPDLMEKYNAVNKIREKLKEIGYTNLKDEQYQQFVTDIKSKKQTTQLNSQNR